ncbi:MAG: caspase family protein, partial [Thermoanaerobaculia bacterium]
YTEPDQANLGTALQVWLAPAEAGDAEAQFYVGQIFEKGMGVPPDYGSAVAWYRRAAEQGHAAAQIGLGSFYETGRGVTRDPQAALQWYRRAAGLADDLVVLQSGEYRQLTEAQQELERAQEELEERSEEVEALRREIEEQEPPPPSGPTRGALSFGRYHALVIGNSTYRALPALPTAANDARAVAEVLRSRYGFEVELLLDATRFDIMRALNGLRETLNADDNLLVYYAGHARREEGGAAAYWQPVDAEPGSPANWIPTDLVSEHLDLVPARHVLVVADAHFSGLRTRSSIAQLPAGKTEEERYYAIRLLLDKRCRLVLTSGEPAPRPGPPPGERSVFATAFVETLRHNQGLLESSLLYRELNRELTATAGSQPLELAAMQWARSEVSEFFFVSQAS